MPSFAYRAVDPEGNVVEGLVQVVDEAAALAHLRSERLSPLRVAEQGAAQASRQRRGRVGRREIAHLTQQLASMLQANLPLARALAAIRDQAGTESVRELVADLGSRVEGGELLSEALAAHPRHFPDFYRSMVRAGELGGVLAGALARIAAMQEKREALVSKLRGALTYPAIMVVVMAASIAVLLAYVVPRFAETFADMGAALPLPTRILMATSGFVASWWWLILGSLAVVGAGLWQWAQTPTGRLELDSTVLRTPVIGPLVQQLGIANIAVTLASLLHTGVPILSAMDAGRDVSGNRVFSQALEQVKGAVREGQRLEAALAEHPALFPGLMVSMVATGEEAGTLPEMLDNVAAYYTRQADERLGVLTTLLEPMITVVMGLVIGAIVIAILLPVFGLSEIIG